MPKIKVEIYPWLSTLHSARRLAKGDRLALDQEIAEGTTVMNFLQELAAREEKLRPHLFDPATGKFTDQVSIVINGRYVDLLDGLDTRLNDGDSLMLFQAWSGG